MFRYFYPDEIKPELTVYTLSFDDVSLKFTFASMKGSGNSSLTLLKGYHPWSFFEFWEINSLPPTHFDSSCSLHLGLTRSKVLIGSVDRGTVPEI
jgi:hypothetical protein